MVERRRKQGLGFRNKHPKSKQTNNNNNNNNNKEEKAT